MTQPPQGPSDRDKFYGTPGSGPSSNSVDPTDEDGSIPVVQSNDDEYELEPPDEHVIAQTKARSEEALLKAEQSVDVDQFYRELNSVGDWDNLPINFKPQFSIYHLLITTTVVAVCLGIWQAGLLNGGGFAVFVVLSLVGLTGTHLYLNWKEKKRQAELIAKHQYQMQKARAEEGDCEQPDMDEIRVQVESPLDEIKEAIFPPLRFSAGEFFGALPIAGALVTLHAVAGNIYATIVSLGVAAVLIMGIYAVGNVVPRFLRIAWWLALIGSAIAHGVLAILGTLS